MLGRRFWIAAAVLGLFSAAAWAADQPAAPSADEIARLVQQLDADRFGERQAASEKLAAAGKAAIPALTKAAVGESLEVTTRAIEILKKLLASSEEPTKQSAKAALEEIAKSDRLSAARRAQEVLRPKQEDPNVPANGIIFGAQGGIIQGIQIAAAANAKKMSVKVTNGVKEIEAEENDRKVKIVDDPKQGIKMEITTKKEGKDVTEKYEAKDADELKKKHPEAHKIYEEYSKNQGGIGMIQVQIQAGGVPVPIPIQPGIRAVPRALRGGPEIAKSQLESAARLLKLVQQQLERLTKDNQWQQAPQETKDQLRKNLDEMKQQITEIEKQLKQADQQKPAAETDKPAEKAETKPAAQEIRPDGTLPVKRD